MSLAGGGLAEIRRVPGLFVRHCLAHPSFRSAARAGARFANRGRVIRLDCKRGKEPVYLSIAAFGAGDLFARPEENLFELGRTLLATVLVDWHAFIIDGFHPLEVAERRRIRLNLKSKGRFSATNGSVSF